MVHCEHDQVSIVVNIAIKLLQTPPTAGIKQHHTHHKLILKMNISLS